MTLSEPLSELIHMVEDQPGTQAVTVSVEDIRTWYADQQEIMSINNSLRDFLLEMQAAINRLVK